MAKLLQLTPPSPHCSKAPLFQVLHRAVAPQLLRQLHSFQPFARRPLPGVALGRFHAEVVHQSEAQAWCHVARLKDQGVVYRVYR